MSSETAGRAMSAHSPIGPFCRCGRIDCLTCTPDEPMTPTRLKGRFWVPPLTARCPDCGYGLTIEPQQWVQTKTGRWLVDDAEVRCGRQGCHSAYDWRGGESWEPTVRLAVGWLNRSRKPASDER